MIDDRGPQQSLREKALSDFLSKCRFDGRFVVVEGIQHEQYPQIKDLVIGLKNELSSAGWYW